MFRECIVLVVLSTSERRCEELCLCAEEIASYKSHHLGRVWQRFSGDWLALLYLECHAGLSQESLG